MTPPPTPASLMEEAEKILTQNRLGHDSEAVAIIGTALHSIQAQTIRDMVKVADSMPCEVVGYGGSMKDCQHQICATGRYVIDALRSYAKDKGIEIE